MSALCPILRTSFDDYLADALPPPQRRMLREHLAACDECRREAVAKDPTFAFARPFIRHSTLPVVPGTGARELVVLLDTSYSMGFADRWERARSAAPRRATRAWAATASPSGPSGWALYAET